MASPDQYVIPSWLEEGMECWVPAGNGSGLRVTVAVAAGDHARVVNEAHQYDAWHHIIELRVERTDKHATRGF